MPSKKQLANMDPSENFKLPGSKKTAKGKKAKPIIKDLDGNTLGDHSSADEDPFDALDQDESFKMANGLAADYYDDGLREKSYTLTMIADPEESGIEKTFIDYKKWMIDNNIPLKPKRMIINASQNSRSQRGGQLLATQAEDDRFKKQNQTVGKVVFLKDRDIEINAFEREITKWVPQFYVKMNSLCVRKPRFSEMRPIRFNL